MVKPYTQEKLRFLDFKIRTLTLVLILTISLNSGFAFFSLMGWHLGGVDLAILNSLFAGVAALLLWYVKQSKQHLLLTSQLISIAALFFFATIAMFMPENSYRLVWFLPLTIFNFLFIGLRFGLLNLAATSVFLFMLHMMSSHLINQTELTSLLVSLATVSLLAYHYSVQIHRYEDAIQTQSNALNKLISQDPMTGILNRRGLMDAALQYCNLAKRNELQSLALAVFDIDFFKTINDRHGHLIGDESIQYITKHIQAHLRNRDLFARIGGDEFVLVLPDTTPEEAQTLLEDIKQGLAEAPMETDCNQQISVQFSAGITARKPTTKSFSDLFKEADQTLYRAKQQGRNQILMA